MMTNELQDKLIFRLDQFNTLEEVIAILDTYLKLHQSQVGAHLLWCAIERIAQGEREEQVLSDYRYYRGIE